MGLAIAYRVVRHHGGVVAARNAEGGGLELTITLPRERLSVFQSGSPDEPATRS